jgi:hypothetical protein
MFTQKRKKKKKKQTNKHIVKLGGAFERWLEIVKSYKLGRREAAICTYSGYHYRQLNHGIKYINQISAISIIFLCQH